MSEGERGFFIWAGGWRWLILNQIPNILKKYQSYWKIPKWTDKYLKVLKNTKMYWNFGNFTEWYQNYFFGIFGIFGIFQYFRKASSHPTAPPRPPKGPVFILPFLSKINWPDLAKLPYLVFFSFFQKAFFVVLTVTIVFKHINLQKSFLL